MNYTVEVSRTAQRHLNRIARDERAAIVAAMQDLANQPRPRGCKKLTGRAAWRIRVGDYRVIYEIHDDRVLVFVIAIGHRKDIYR